MDIWCSKRKHDHQEEFEPATDKKNKPKIRTLICKRSCLYNNFLAGMEGFEPRFVRCESGIINSMNESATRKDIDEVIDIMKDFMSQVSGQFNEVNNRLDKVDKRLDQLDQKYDHLINTIDGFIGRIDKYETELAARDNQFEKLLLWARKVSEKTGIPLENL